MLDTLQHVETPEGVDLALRVAGPLPRLWAWLIDLAIRGARLIALSIPLGLLGYGGIGLTFLVAFALEWLYPMVFETVDAGRTQANAPGLRVVRYDGTPLEWTASVIRNLLRAADWLPFANVTGLISMVLTRDFRRLGDLAAGTVVIHDHRPDVTAAVADSAPVPPPLPLTVDEQRAVVAFAARTPRLSTARALELAHLAAPLVDGSPDPVARLRGIAAWLGGSRPGEARPPAAAGVEATRR